MDKQKRKYLRAMRTKKRTDHLFFLLLFLIFPLIVMKKEIGYLSIHSILFFLAIIRILSVYTSMIWNNHISVKKPSSLLDWSVLGCGMLELSRILFKLVDPDQIGAIHFEPELVLLLFCILYWVYSEGVVYRETYLSVFLYTGLLVVTADLLEKIVGFNLGLANWSVFAVDGVKTSFLMLFCAVAIIRVCYSKDQYQRLTYGALALLGTFAFFLEKSLVGITVLALIFPVILLTGTHTILTLKQTIICTFSYFFLLSNIPLVIEILELNQLNGFYKLEYSIYIDLLLSVFGLVILHYWEKYCKDKEDSFEISKINEITKYFFYIIGISILFIVSFILQGGSHYLQDKVKIVSVYCSRMSSELTSKTGGILQAIDKQGIVGMIVYLVLFALFIWQMISSYKKKKNADETWILSVFGLIQTVVFPFSIYVSVLYGALLLFTMFGQADEHIFDLKLRK